MADLGATGVYIGGTAEAVIFPVARSKNVTNNPMGGTDAGNPRKAWPYPEAWRELSGLVTADGVGAIREVFALHRASKMIHARAASSESGAFVLRVPFGDQQYTVLAEGGPGENVVGADFVLPV